MSRRGRAPDRAGVFADAPARRRHRGLAGRSREGQVLVIFAFAVIGLLAAAGMAIDVGRFYAERRFLQNAADSAALAAAAALIRGENAATAEAEARDLLTRNYAAAPNGAPSLPSAVPVYASGHAGDPTYLVDGILIGGGDIRVAVRHNVDYTVGRAIGLGTNQIGAQARARWHGRLLPIAVPHYLNGSGPYVVGGVCPSPLNLSVFVDALATESTACLGDLTNIVARVLPSPGSPWDPLNPANDPIHHGPIVTILGQGAQPANGADFRGFVALDIRNFASAGSQVYYNGITAGTNANTLKAAEAGYITAKGYPGPDFPVVISPPDPNDQVAAMSGNATGIAISAMAQTFAPGDEILVCVYDGSVQAIPDFTMSAPAFLSLPATGVTVNAGVMKVSRNQAFSGQVTLSTVADTLDPANPMLLGTLLGIDPILYIPNPVTPSLGSGTNVLVNQLTTVAATPGIYDVWIKGVAGSPYLTTKFVPVPIQIGTITRDFSFTSDVQLQSATNVGDSAVFNLTLQNSPNKNTNFGGPVTLSLDPVLASGIGGPARTGMGAVTFGSTTVTPSKNGTSTTLTINTGTMAPGIYNLVVRATGMNGDVIPRSVTHLLPLQLSVATGGNGGQYVDIDGFAIMRVVDIGSNSVTAYAITPAYADMNDPHLLLNQQARLVPWS